MIKNHTHNNNSGSIHYIFKKILDLGIIKKAFTIVPLFFKSYAFPCKLCNVLVYDIVFFISFLIFSKYSAVLLHLRLYM